MKKEKYLKKEYENVFHAAGFGIAMVALDGSWIEVNNKLCSMLNYSKEELLKKTFEEITHPDDMGKGLGKIQEILLQTDEEYHIEKRCFKKDGSMIWVSVSITITFNENQTPKYFIFIINDITEIKDAQKISKLSEERLNFAITGSNIGLWDWNLETDEVYFSPQWKYMLGFKENEISGSLEEWENRVHPDDIDDVKKDLTEHMQGMKDFYENEHRVLCKNGKYKWILDRGKVVEYSQSGEPLRMSGTHTDIDDKVRISQELINAKNSAEELAKELQENKKMLDEAQRISNVGSWSENAITKELIWSDEIFRILELDPKEYIPTNESCMSTVHPHDREKLIDTFSTSIKTKQPYYLEHRLLMSDGRIKYVIQQGEYKFSENGKVLSSQGILKDITQLKESELKALKAQESAEAASQAKSDFLANMSHEIRTPLNGIIGLTDIVLKTELNEKQRNYLEKAKSSSASLLHVINDILDFSKIEAGKLDIENSPFKLKEVIQGIQNTFEHIAEKKGLNFLIEYENHLDLEGDALRLTQVLTNLVGNAIKFTKEGSVSIEIKRLKESEKSVELKFIVKDTGIGMSKKVQEHLFQEFTQADSSTTREFGGSGLGLAITKKLISLMDGKIFVESHEGKGSTFSFSLVFKKIKIDEKENLSTETSIDEKLFRDKQILVAEDNKTNQLVVMGMLEDLGIKLDFVNNGKEAVDKFNAKKYDLILMDLQMPVMGGIEATDIIRSKDENIPIIALTAAVMKEEIEKTKEVKMNAHIAKPVNRQTLVSVLGEFLV